MDLGISVTYSILRESVNIISEITNIANKLGIHILIYIFIIFIIFVFMMNTSDNEMGDLDKNEVDYNEFINYPDNSDDDDENSKKRKRIDNNNKSDENSRKEKSFDIIKFNGKIYKSKGNKTLLDIYKNSKSPFFKKYKPTKKLWYKKRDSKELDIFNESIDSILKEKANIDVKKYETMYHVREPRKYYALKKGFISVQGTNRHLMLNWREQCRVYAILHHKSTTLDIKDIKNWTPETFYTFIQIGKSNKTLGPRWEYIINKYLMDPSKKYELYTYMRIACAAIDTPQSYLTKLRIDYMTKHVVKFVLDALNKK